MNKMFVKCLYRLLFGAMVAISNLAVSYASDKDIQSIIDVELYKKASFSPSKGDVFELNVGIDESIDLDAFRLEITSFDGDLIRSDLKPTFNKETKRYSFAWDGKDNKGVVVPNESYHPVFTIGEREKKIEWNAKSFSGGEEIYNFNKNFRTGEIEYNLPVASRVLIRAGVQNGALLRTLIDWEPRAAGLHVERWNGRDADDVELIETNPKIAYLVVGYKLPDASIITYGNSKETYREYREKRNLSIAHATYEGRLLERDGVVIRPEFYTPVLQQKSPQITVSLLNSKTRKSTDTVGSFAEVIVKVEMDELDEIYLDQQKYEISFFIDGEFISEEEQGFVPFSWKVSPTRLGIKPGRHVLTVNVSGYSGQVGVRHMIFSLGSE